MKYSRIVIALKNDKSGFGLNGRSPAGRTIVEARGDEGKLSLQVQDLKAESIYKIYMISANSQSSKGVHIGNLEINSKGKGEFKKEFDRITLNSMPLNIKDINTVAIFSGDEKNKNIPLSGSKNEDVNWKNNFFIVKIQEPAIHKEKPKETKKSLPEILEKNNTSISVAKKNIIIPVPMESNYKMPDNKVEYSNISINENSKATIEPTNTEKEISHIPLKEPSENKAIVSDAEKWDEVKDIPKINNSEEDGKQENRKNRNKNKNPLNKNTKSIDSFAKTEDFFEELPKENENINKINFEDNFKNITKQLNKEIDELDYIKFEYDETNKQKDFFIEKKPEKENYSKNKPKLPKNELDNLFDKNPKMQPFEKQTKNIRWVKTTMKDLALLPIDFWRLMNHPFIIASYKKYNHLMFGERDDKNKTYFLAIPSVYENEYKENANLLGFTQFKSCDNKKNEEGNFGYWVMTV